MRWQGERRSRNVEDRRGMGGGAKMVGGGIGMVIVAAIVMLLGGDPSGLIGGLGGGPGVVASGPGGEIPADDEQAQFVATVLASTEDVWSQVLPGYRDPGLVLFDDAVESACGIQGAAVGPFYCPGDSNVYLDLGFFRQLEHDLGAPGDFAQAYVIAHEVGHHVQNLLGTARQVAESERGMSESERNAVSVRMELQADFYAGVWAHHAAKAKALLEQGDLEEALRAASRIGDDVLQKRSRGRVSPDSFTHGTAEQRMRWFRRGYETGDVRQGDTFSAKQL